MENEPIRPRKPGYDEIENRYYSVKEPLPMPNYKFPLCELPYSFLSPSEKKKYDTEMDAYWAEIERIANDTGNL